MYDDIYCLTINLSFQDDFSMTFQNYKFQGHFENCILKGNDR